MTVATQVSVYSQVFVPREYEVLAHHSIAATFTDHDRLLQSLRLPYSAGQLLNYVRTHFPQQRLSSISRRARDHNIKVRRQAIPGSRVHDRDL